MLVEAANLLDADQRAGRPTCPTRCRSDRPASVSWTCCSNGCRRRRSALLVAAAEPDGDLVRILTRGRTRPRRRRPRGRRGARRGHARRRPPHVPPPADALGGIPRRPAPSGEPPTAPSPTTLPVGSPAGPGTWRAAVGPDEEVARRSTRPPAHRPAGRPERGRPAPGSWPAGCRRTAATGSAGCASPRRHPRRRDGGGGRAPARPGRAEVVDAIRRPTTSSSGSAAASCAAGCQRRAVVSSEAAASLRKAAAEVAGAAPERRRRPAVRRPRGLHPRRCVRRHGAPSRRPARCRTASTRTGPAHRRDGRAPLIASGARAASSCSTATRR